MRVSPFVYAAEVEQAATATAVLDSGDTWASSEAVNELFERYSLAGWDLVNEYENEPSIVDDAVTPLFVVFH